MIKAIKQNFLYKSVVAILEMSGILIAKLTPLRVVLILLIIAEIIAFKYIPFLTSYGFSIWYAVIWFIVRQTFLFWSFTPKGLAYQMKKKMG